MKKERFTLQLFAQESPDAGPLAGEETTAGGGQEGREETREKDRPRYTDSDVDKILNQKFALWQAKKQKEIDEAARLADMNAQQRAEYQRDRLQKELERYKEQAQLSQMAATARQMLGEKGIAIDDGLLRTLVSAKAEETQKAVEGFASAFHRAVEEAVRERVRGEPPKRGGSFQGLSKEQIMAIRDPELRQQKMLENKALFNF